MRHRHVLLFLAAACLLLSRSPAHAHAADAQSDERTFTIVTTVGMVGDIVKHVVGERGDVRNIIGEGVDPHLYKPTRNDVASLQSADVVFYCGLMLEGKMTDALIRVARRRPVYAVTELVDESKRLQPEEFEGHWDPHLWMDVSLWMTAVEAVATAMAEEIDPTHAAEYRANAAAYLKRLSALDAYAKRCIASIPKERRVLVTAHDAFNYFGRAYGLDVLGIQGISTESEAGLDDINSLIDLLVDRGVAAVFVETSVADRNVRALIEGAEARDHNVSIGGALFSDAMGSPGTYEGTYIGMIDHNVTTITRALGGTAPAGGMNGRLGKTPATE